MKTQHQILFQNAKSIAESHKESIDLVVTSPPYPMIEMWDELFSEHNLQVRSELDQGHGEAAFELMHETLDQVWSAVVDALRPGGILCINIGDATRSIGKDFRLYSNHSRIVTYCRKLGLANLTNILWRKQTNAPNKFMGSGMLPVGAYVTLEHEYILIFRKGARREFTTEEQKRQRMNSAFFWEERNVWFSDIWDIKGTLQKLNNDKSRQRSAAFPFEIPYRLISMFSVKGDWVLDPFLGTGTTTIAALCAGRNSVGCEIDTHLAETIFGYLKNDDLVVELNSYIRGRFVNHTQFVSRTQANKGENSLKHVNRNYGFPVMTRQETGLVISYIDTVTITPDGQVETTYVDKPVLDHLSLGSLFAQTAE